MDNPLAAHANSLALGHDRVLQLWQFLLKYFNAIISTVYHAFGLVA